jgi:hypothetical protein
MERGVGAVLGEWHETGQGLAVRLGDVVTVPIQSDVLAMRVREQEKIRER